MRRPLLTAALLGATAIAPSAAGAAAVAVPAGCHAPTLADPKNIAVPFTASGLTPGQTASVSVAAQGFLDAPSTPLAITADAAGNAAGTVTIPSTQGIKPFPDVPATITLADGAGAPLATAPATLGNIGLKIGTGKLTSLKKKVKWEVSGLSTIAGGQTTYYAFYFKASDAKKGKLKVKGKQKLGTATGACGYLEKKRPLAPFRTPGDYVVAIIAQAKFDPKVPGIVGVAKIARIKKR